MPQDRTSKPVVSVTARDDWTLTSLYHTPRRTLGDLSNDEVQCVERIWPIASAVDSTSYARDLRKSVKSVDRFLLPAPGAADLL
jgi:hypothetical protein